MILPTKHLRSEASLIYVGGIIQNIIAAAPQTVDQLWHSTKREYIKHSPDFDITYDWFVLALSLLYAMNAISFVDDRIVGVPND